MEDDEKQQRLEQGNESVVGSDVDWLRTRLNERLNRQVNESFFRPQPSAIAGLSGLGETYEATRQRIAQRMHEAFSAAELSEQRRGAERLDAMGLHQRMTMNAELSGSPGGLRGSSSAQEQARFPHPPQPGLPVLTPWGEAHPEALTNPTGIPLAPDAWFRREILRRADAPFNGGGKSFLDWAFQTFDEYVRRKNEG
jgi:hypothetical protein